MNNIFFIYLFIILISFLITYSSLPLILKKSKFLDSYDRKESRKVAVKPIPRIGGLSIILGISITQLTIIFLGNNFPILGISQYNLTLYLVFSLIFYILGFFDDIKPASPIFRLFFQLTISTSIWLSGIGIKAIDLSFLNTSIPEIIVPSFISLILTLLWISGIVNAINWLDGIDGLAITFSLINFIFLLIICISNNNNELAIISAISIGSCLGFLPKNIKPAKIYMGDGGSYLLGFNLAFISMLCTTYSEFGESRSFIKIRPEITLLILLIPVLDMLIVIFLRLKNRDSPIVPDRKHIHHRLQRLGFNTNETLLLITSFAGINSSLALVFLNIRFAKFSIVIFLVGILFIFFNKKKFKQFKNSNF